MAGAGDQPGTHIRDLCIIQAGIVDGLLHGDIRIRSRITHKAQVLAVDQRFQVDVDRTADLAAQPHLGKFFVGRNPGTPQAQGLGDVRLVVSKAGHDAHARYDDSPWRIHTELARGDEAVAQAFVGGLRSAGKATPGEGIEAIPD